VTVDVVVSGKALAGDWACDAATVGVAVVVDATSVDVATAVVAASVGVGGTAVLVGGGGTGVGVGSEEPQAVRSNATVVTTKSSHR
jgi:hypothetical protein